MTPDWTVADRLRKARKLAGIGAKEMAHKLAVDPATISRWENGAKVPTTGLMSYALVCEVPLEWLESGNTQGYRQLMGAAA